MRDVEFGGIRELAEEQPIRWLVPGWLPDHELTLLWGREGTYKSFIALDWSLKMALEKKVVVYIAAEGLSGLRARVHAWLSQHEDVDPKYWHYFNSNIYLNQPALRSRWIEALKEYLAPGYRGGRYYSEHPKPDLIVVDTLDRCYDGEENSSKEMGHFIDGVEAIRRELECAVLIIHHTRKGGDRERGTTALPAAVFASHHVSDPTRRPKTGGGSVKMECTKMKDAQPPSPVTVELERVTFIHDVTPELEEVIHSSLVVKEFETERLPKPVSGKMKARKAKRDTRN